MAARLSEYEQETLLFMIDFDVPFDNNQAGRDLRMPKAKQKISGGFRTEAGAKSFARIRGFISTAKKKAKNIFDGLVSVFKGNPRKFLYPNHN
jgi:transposase